MLIKYLKFCMIIIILFYMSNSYARQISTDTLEHSDLFNMSIQELMQIKVKVASKSEEKLKDAPSVISIINRRQISNLNPRNLSDILNIIPGFNYQISNLGSPLFQFRGIHSVNDQILLMIDGHPKPRSNGRSVNRA